MPTREEIAKALRCEKCVENNCPYYCVRWRDCNYRKMTTDAADLIERQAEEIERLKRERDAAIADLYKAKSCNTCDKQSICDSAIELVEQQAKEIEQLKDELGPLRVYAKHIAQQPDCNDCAKKECMYRPKLGEYVRKNCPLWLRKATKLPGYERNKGGR